MSAMDNPIRVTRTSTSLDVHADIDGLLRIWGEEKTALLVCLSAWMHKINQLDEIYQLLIQIDNEDYTSTPIFMLAGLISEGYKFFAKNGKVSTHFRKEISADSNLREAVDALQKFHSEPVKGLPGRMNMIRRLRNKYSFHPDEYKAVLKALQYWRGYATRDDRLGEMAIYSIDCDNRPHFDAGGCDALYLLGLFDIPADSSLITAFAELINRLGKDVAKLRNLTGSFFIHLGEYLERQQP